MAAFYQIRRGKRTTTKTLGEGRLVLKSYPDPQRTLLVVESVGDDGKTTEFRLRLMGDELAAVRNELIGQL